MRYLWITTVSTYLLNRRWRAASWPGQILVYLYAVAASASLTALATTAATSEPPHPSLLFQHSDHRFHQRFSSLINSSAGRTQFPPHSVMRRITGLLPQPSASIQPARQVRVRHIAVDLALLQRLQILQREESTVGTGSLRFLSALLFHPIHHRQQRLVIVGVLRHLLREPAPLPQKAAVGIAPRQLRQPRFAQPQTLRSLFPCCCSSRAIASRPTPLPAPSFGSSASHCRCQRRMSRRMRARSACSVSIRFSATPFAAMRVASMAIHHLREHIIQRSRLSPAKVVQRPVIRRGPRCQVAERQILANALLQPPRTGHPQRVGIQPNRDQHLRSVSRPAFFSILTPEHFQVSISSRSGGSKSTSDPVPIRPSRSAAADTPAPGCNPRISPSPLLSRAV